MGLDRRTSDIRIDRIEKILNEIHQRQIEKTVPGIDSANAKIALIEESLHGKNGLLIEHGTCQHRIQTLEHIVYWIIGVGALQVGALLIWIGKIDNSVRHLTGVINKITGN